MKTTRKNTIKIAGRDKNVTTVTAERLTARTRNGRCRVEVLGWKRLAVIRQVRDRAGQVLGHIAAKHDGTPAGVITAAKAITDRMFMLFDNASNMNSVIIATDAGGVPRWLISPNFRFITEIEAQNTSAIPDSAILALNAEN